MSDLDHLVAHAHETRVVVIGAGIAGLVAALECAKVGMSVTVLEASGIAGGVVRSAQVAGITLDVGAESFATRGGTVRAMIDELGLGDDVVVPSSNGAWVAGLPGGDAAPLPAGGVLGIPDNPWDPTVRRIIGWGGAWRAYLDRLRPPLTIGTQRNLGHLVRSRMGERVLDRLVAPVTTGVYSARPDDVDVDLAAPGLNAALTRAGSLSGAVAQLRAGRTSAPGGAVAGIDGGMWRLAAALVDQLGVLGVTVHTDHAVAVVQRADEEWHVRTTDADTEPLPADLVIVATPEAAARRLLAPAVPELADEDAAAPEIEIVTLVLDAPVLNAHPRGNGVLTVPGTTKAKALTHASAKWEWVARDAGSAHVVRLSFGAQGEPPASAGLDDAALTALAVEQASVLLGVPLESTQVRGVHRERYVQSQPASVIGRSALTAAARGAVRAAGGLAVVGAWVSGTGLAQVIPDAVAEADRARREALWGSREPS